MNLRRLFPSFKGAPSKGGVKPLKEYVVMAKAETAANDGRHRTDIPNPFSRPKETAAEPPLMVRYRQGLISALWALPLNQIGEVLTALRSARRTGNQVFIIGNGGSAATAAHIVADLAKSASRPDVRRLRVVSLADNVPLLTAWGNDTGYENVFRQQLANLAKPGDLLIALSASGNSENVIRAVRDARVTGLHTIGMTGMGGGKLRRLVDICLAIQSESPGQIEDAHLAIGHMLAQALAQGDEREG